MAPEPASASSIEKLKNPESMYVCVCICRVITHSKRDQPDKIANPARDQQDMENVFFLSPFAPENLVLRDKFGSPVPRQPAHLHSQAKYVA